MAATTPNTWSLDLRQRYPRVLITGGSGFIGSHVVRQALGLGLDVAVLLMEGDAALNLAGLQVTRFRGDVTDTHAVARAAAGRDLIIHMAAIYAIWLPRPERMFEVNVGGTRAVLAAARLAGVRRVVQTSSIAAIGYRPGDAVSDESDAFNDWKLGNDYVLSKYLSEVEAFAGAGDDLEVVCVNPAFPFGAQDRAPTPTGKMIYDIMRGRMPVLVKGGLNVVDVRDVAEGHLRAAILGRSGRRYLLSGHNRTYQEISDTILDKVGRRRVRRSLSGGSLRRAAWAAEWLADRTGRAPMLSVGSVAYAADRHLYFSCERARTELGYQPRAFEDAMDAAVGWFSRWSGGRPPVA